MLGEGGSEIAVILLDENGTIVDAHASCTEVFGWERSELLGKDVRELLQYGRDLLMSQLHNLEDDLSGNTSFSVRVLAKRKDNRQFPARATVRRFRELECWTVAFYEASDAHDTQASPVVSPEEIALAKRALESGTPVAIGSRKEKSELQKDKSMSVSRLWRNSRLLFNSRDEKSAEQPEPQPEAEKEDVEQSISRDSVALAKQVPQISPEPPEVPASPVAVTPAAETGTPLPQIPPTASTTHEKSKTKVSSERSTPQLEPKMPAPAAPNHSRQDPSPVSGDALASHARLKAELEKERGERTRIEQRCTSLSSQVQSLHLQLSESLNLEQENSGKLADLDRELRESREELLQVKSEVDSERRDRQSIEEHLNVLKGLNSRLEETLRLTEAKASALEAAQQETRDFLTNAQVALRDTEAELDRERELRQKAEAAFTSAERHRRASEEDSAAERSTLKSLLAIAELERSRSEDQVLRSRAESLEATREARSRLNRVRKNFSAVLEHINGTTSELLQSPLSDEQKCVIESLLQDLLSLESTFEKEAVQTAGAV